MKQAKIPLQSLTPFPLINAVILGEQQGVTIHTGEIYFISHKSGFSYIERGNEEYDYSALLNMLVESDQMQAYFHIYDPPISFVNLCDERKDIINVRSRERVQLRYSKETFSLTERVPNGFYIEPITVNNFSSLDAFSLQLDKKFWASKEDFLQHGFGYCVFSDKGEPASLCYSACVSSGVTEIDVNTLPAFQQLGLAKCCVNYFVRDCFNNNLEANWDCFTNNIGSVETAKSVGFDKILNYTFLSIYKKESYES